MKRFLLILALFVFMTAFLYADKVNHNGSVSFDLGHSFSSLSEYVDKNTKISQSMFGFGIVAEVDVEQYFTTFLEGKMGLGLDVSLGFNKPYYIKERSAFKLNGVDIDMFFIRPAAILIYSVTDRISVKGSLGLGYEVSSKHSVYEEKQETQNVYQLQMFTGFECSYRFNASISLDGGFIFGGNVYSAVEDLKDGRWAKTFIIPYIGLAYNYSVFY